MSTTSLAAAQAASVSITLAFGAAAKVRIAERDRQHSLAVSAAANLARYVRLEPLRAATISWTLVAFEGATAVAIAVPATIIIGLATATAFFVTAFGVAFWGRSRVPQTTCGCFGGADRASWWTVGRAAWLSLASVSTLSFHPSSAWNRPAVVLLAVIALNSAIIAATIETVRATALRLYRLAKPMLTRPNARRGRNGVALNQVVDTPYWRSLAETGALVSPTPARTW